MTVNELTFFPVTGYFNTGELGALESFDTTVVFTARVPPGFTALISNLDLGSGTGADVALAFPPIAVSTNSGVLSTQLLSNSAPVAAALAAAGISQLIYDVQFTKITLGYQIQNFSIIAPTDTTPVCLTDPGLTRYEFGGTVPVVSLPDGITAFGVELIGAADATTALSDLGGYSKPSGGIPATDLSSAVQAELALANTALQRNQWPFPMARNTIAVVGDSITALGDFTGGVATAPPTTYQPTINYTYIQQLPILTHQRIRWGAGMWAVSGSYVDAQVSQQLPVVLAMDPLPGACVLACGAANMIQEQTSAPAWDFATSVGYVESAVAQLLAAGVVPIMFCIPPLNSDLGFGISVATLNVRLNQWNVWVRRYAAMNGFPLIDAHTALAQVDGTHIPGTTTDLVHPNVVGHTLIAQQALADGLADIFPPNSLVNTARTTDDLTNLFNNGTINYGLFTTDSNSDGLADGLTVHSGTGTYSLVGPNTADLLMGNWQQMTVTAGNAAVLYGSITTGWSVGDIIAFSCRVQTENIASSGAEFILSTRCDVPGGWTPPYGGSQTAATQGIYEWTAGDIADGEVYVEFPIPAGTTTFEFQAWIVSVASGSATLRFGEVTIRNLTQGGFLI